ncbi:MAG TPA: YicC/YloC family endoribonuclease [Nitrospira sp.]|nr:YicC/YloC family endoribonuclease [Nitrospira sp.]
MTGYGRHQASWIDGLVTVEVRAVNHRFLEVACRLPRPLQGMEEALKKAVQQRCRRGRVDLTVTIQAGKGRGGLINVDQQLATQYHRALRRLKTSLKLPGPIDVALIAGLRDVLTVSDQSPEDSSLTSLVHQLVDDALDQMLAMRKQEGVALAKDMQGRLRTMKDHRSAVAGRAPMVVQEAFERMKERVGKLLGSDAPDIPRLHQELAMYADRGDITEEIVRLDSHMLQFDQQLTRMESVGKTLEFLLQEMGREVNTIGSKANDAVIAGHVVQMKAELERLREQVQNVE